ncbi:hypothetical protein ABEP16_27415 [Priestia aryabhattai]|uniref:hypothetical protein n=1 Tax=Priestia aryabhattai TaxID=412384 RepID=UPI003D2A5CA5
MNKKEDLNKDDLNEGCITNAQDKGVLKNKQCTHSESFNFASYTQNSIDPRTGDYTMNIDAEGKSSKES